MRDTALHSDKQRVCQLLLIPFGKMLDLSRCPLILPALITVSWYEVRGKLQAEFEVFQSSEKLLS